MSYKTTLCYFFWSACVTLMLPIVPGNALSAITLSGHKLINRFDFTINPSIRLNLAIKDGNLDESLLISLLGQGASIHDFNDRPLLLAIEGNFPAIVQLLLRWSLRPDQTPFTLVRIRNLIQTRVAHIAHNPDLTRHNQPDVIVLLLSQYINTTLSRQNVPHQDLNRITELIIAYLLPALTSEEQSTLLTRVTTMLPQQTSYVGSEIVAVIQAELRNIVNRLIVAA